MNGNSIIATDSLLVSENPRGMLVVPSATLPKATVAGSACVAGIPAPLSATAVGLFEAELLIVSVPDCVPSVAGVNVMPMLQLAPAAKGLLVEHAGLALPASL